MMKSIARDFMKAVYNLPTVAMDYIANIDVPTPDFITNARKMFESAPALIPIKVERDQPKNN